MKAARLLRAGRLIVITSCAALYAPNLTGALLGERIGAKLQLHKLGGLALATFAVERRAVAGACPHAATFPAAVRIVDAAVDQLGEEALRIGHDEVDHFAVLEGDDRFVLVAGGVRNILAEAERVVLVDPGVVAGFRRTRAGIVGKLRSRERIERPALWAVLAVAHGRPVGNLALA